MSSLHIESYGQGEPVVLLHGWAMHSGIWGQFAQSLADHYQVICVDLPGHGHSGKPGMFTLSAVCAQLAAELPVASAHWLGWSLGGSVTLEMARLFPERVTSVLLLASNPRFVKESAWPGMNASVLKAFAEQLTVDCQATLMRFLSLQIKGVPEFKILSRQLRHDLQARAVPDNDTLASGLTVLQNADLRPVLANLTQPVALLLGGRDTLVPVAVGAALRNLNPSLRLQVFESAGHVPFLSHQQEVLTAIIDFLELS